MTPTTRDGVRVGAPPIYAILTVVAASLVLLLSEVYVYLNPAYDITSLVVGVVFPLLFGSVVFVAARQRLLLFAFLAYFWSIVDDAPVYFDSVYTWPEVTRFHPLAPHLFLEVVLHLLTLGFLSLALREALRGTRPTRSKLFKVSLLALIAFILSYAQNIPLASVQALVDSNWYGLDVAEHAVSLVFLYLAVREARSP